MGWWVKKKHYRRKWGGGAGGWRGQKYFDKIKSAIENKWLLMETIIWPDKSTTRYDMLDFKSYIKSLARKYRIIKL